jgi:hypothetical protein
LLLIPAELSHYQKFAVFRATTDFGGISQRIPLIPAGHLLIGLDESRGDVFLRTETIDAIADDAGEGARFPREEVEDLAFLIGGSLDE